MTPISFPVFPPQFNTWHTSLVPYWSSPRCQNLKHILGPMELSKIFKIWNTSWALIEALQDIKIWNIFCAQCNGALQNNQNLSSIPETHLGPLLELSKISKSETFFGPYRALQNIQDLRHISGPLLKLSKMSKSETYFGPNGALQNIQYLKHILGP